MLPQRMLGAVVGRERQLDYAGSVTTIWWIMLVWKQQQFQDFKTFRALSSAGENQHRVNNSNLHWLRRQCKEMNASFYTPFYVDGQQISQTSYKFSAVFCPSPDLIAVTHVTGSLSHTNRGGSG